MQIQLYNPFEFLEFDPQICFLSGVPLDAVDKEMRVFPQWILDRYSLAEKKFTLMDQITSFKYEDLKIPCSKEVRVALDALEQEIEKAFTAGYEEVVKLPQERLFQWMAKLVYGVLYNDLLAERKRAGKRGIQFQVSPLLRKRFSLLHLMLQSVVIPMEFRGTKPWSIEIVKIKISKDIFNYKDEPTHLNFSLGMNDFGIAACLQDNGAIVDNQRDILKKISGKILHPVQFEELCGRFIYANYLLRKDAEYNIEPAEEKIIIEPVSVVNGENNVTFGRWDDDMFAQVLADYWKPWGLTKKDIYEFPNSPVSYLENELTHEFIEPDSIPLPF